MQQRGAHSHQQSCEALIKIIVEKRIPQLNAEDKLKYTAIVSNLKNKLSSNIKDPCQIYSSLYCYEMIMRKTITFHRIKEILDKLSDKDRNQYYTKLNALQKQELDSLSTLDMRDKKYLSKKGEIISKINDEIEVIYSALKPLVIDKLAKDVNDLNKKHLDAKLGEEYDALTHSESKFKKTPTEETKGCFTSFLLRFFPCCFSSDEEEKPLNTDFPKHKSYSIQN